MKRVVIIEDEIPARKKIFDFIQRLDQGVEIIAELASVQEALEFFSNTQAVDLIFSDIRLLDGHSFEIFESVKVNCPVIFTTAYDRYWMDAFEVNGIDYLLKPYGFDRFLKSWEKFVLITRSASDLNTEFMNRFQDFLNSQKSPDQKFKSRIRVSNNSGMYFLELSHVAYFLAEGGLVWAMESTGKKHLLRQSTLKELEEILDPSQFYRLNRSELINKFYVERLERYNKNTVTVSLKNSTKTVISSQNATSGFLDWLEG